MLVIGLTGGIGSGKSTVAEFFRELGVPVIDTDEISRQLVRPGEKALDEIIDVFGDVLTSNGELDRNKVREIIFKDASKRMQIEHILHPKIQQEVLKQLNQVNHSYAVVVIPLLTEKGKYSFIDRVLVVDCGEQLQLQRAMSRDNQNKQQIEEILKSQATRQERLEIADDVILNESDVNDLQQAVNQLNKTYLQIAGN